MAPARRLAHEAAFLPAALELQETAVSPAPRVALWLLLALLGVGGVWVTIGRIDVVASARGRIIQSDRSKTIQPSETATVTRIRVAEGQTVRGGEVLIELDATPAAADVTRLRSEWETAQLQAARAEAFLRALEPGAPVPSLAGPAGGDPVRAAVELRLLHGQMAEYRSRLARLEAEEARREAELRSALEIVEKLTRTLPIVRQQAESYRMLYEEHGISRSTWLDREQQRIELEQELAVQRSHVEESRVAIREVRMQQTALTAETRRTALDLLQDGERKGAAAAQELVKARQRERLMRLVAPVTGTVQQLAIHTVGGVVTPAQVLMIIVPVDDPLELEVFVENKDIGFVHTGQAAEVKVETFPYTKHGTVPATVRHVATDAIQDEKRGLVFPARLSLQRTTLPVGQTVVPLAPGMAVTAEIQTDRRRLVEYFLSPLLQYAKESFRER